VRGNINLQQVVELLKNNNNDKKNKRRSKCLLCPT
jgi:hypothetical protein